MDSKQFDELVARLASSPSRRDALKGAVGGALAAVGVSSVATAKKKKAKAEACIPTGKKCPAKKPRGKKKRKLGCNKCCQGFSVANPRGGQKCACKPTGTPCAAEGRSQCCSGVCTSGQCAPY